MKRPRVLLADDHPGLNAEIERPLAMHDYEVVGSVENGGRLLEEAARLQPDIIVADLNMPRMNGIDACRALTRMLPRTRVIVLTAEDAVALKQFVLAAGAFAFIEKRTIGPDLLPAVRAACGNQPMSATDRERFGGV